jgi:ATP-dependent DNA helicase RecQ
LAASSSLTFAYVPEDRNRPWDAPRLQNWNDEKSLEYAIVRLIVLGVVRDYVKDYNGKKFELELAPEWEACRGDVDALREYLALHFQSYVRRYRVRRTGNGEQKIRDAETVEDAENAAASGLVNYVYNQIERERRQASRQMLELARKGVTNADAFRRELMLYLQVSERFTNELEALAKTDDVLSWTELVHRAASPDEIRELHGACSRVLESFPTHPGLLCISALTRLAPNGDELRLSAEEFRAALRYAVEGTGVPEAKALGDAVSAISREIDPTLEDGLHVEFGLWLMQNGREQEAVSRFFVRQGVRDQWLAGILKSVHEVLPSVRGV